MFISFFEEFPTGKNLEKIRMISWPAKVYIAAKSMDDYVQIRKLITNRNIKEIIYWPVVERSEGYWISPFTKRKALIRVFSECRGKNIPIMIDAELPTTQNPFLYITQGFNFFRNKRLIEKFLRMQKTVYIAEYAPMHKNILNIMGIFGLHFDPAIYKNKIIKMCYHSMHHESAEEAERKINEGRRLWGKNFIIGYGTIASGIQGNEPILPYKKLEEDLLRAEKAGVDEVIIFRLGGLNKRYAQIIKNHAVSRGQS